MNKKLLLILAVFGASTLSLFAPLNYFAAQGKVNELQELVSAFKMHEMSRDALLGKRNRYGSRELYKAYVCNQQIKDLNKQMSKNLVDCHSIFTSLKEATTRFPELLSDTAFWKCIVDKNESALQRFQASEIRWDSEFEKKRASWASKEDGVLEPKRALWGERLKPSTDNLCHWRNPEVYDEEVGYLDVENAEKFVVSGQAHFAKVTRNLGLSVAKKALIGVHCIKCNKALLEEGVLPDDLCLPFYCEDKPIGRHPISLSPKKRIEVEQEKIISHAMHPECAHSVVVDPAACLKCGKNDLWEEGVISAFAAPERPAPQAFGNMDGGDDEYEDGEFYRESDDDDDEE